MSEERKDSAREQRVNEAIAAYLAALRAGQQPDPKDWLARHSDLAGELAEFFADRARFERFADALGPTAGKSAVHIRCPHCRNPIELVQAGPREEVQCPSCGSSFRLESASTAAWTRPRKLGRFELIDTVGTGAFGTVYKARDPELDRLVAIKVPRTGNLGTKEDLDRFLREARSVAQLTHPAIVPVYEVCEWRAEGASQPLPYLVSEFVHGITLADLLSARRPTPPEAAALIAKVADALQYAHEHGVVHRDVKPSNVMLETPGVRNQESGVSKADKAGSSLTPDSCLLTPRLMDFGLAKRETGEITMTIDGQVLGTPAYMSPEQARGEGHGPAKKSKPGS